MPDARVELGTVCIQSRHITDRASLPGLSLFALKDCLFDVYFVYVLLEFDGIVNSEVMPSWAVT